jgi:hypothetical protein
MTDLEREKFFVEFRRKLAMGCGPREISDEILDSIVNYCDEQRRETPGCNACGYLVVQHKGRIAIGHGPTAADARKNAGSLGDNGGDLYSHPIPNNVGVFLDRVLEGRNAATA